MARRNRRINYVVLLGGVLVLMGLGASGILVRPLFEPDQVVPARFGDVAWNHELHARMKEIANCQVCHHKARQGSTQPKPCRECHKPQKNADALVLADLHMEVEKVKYEGDKGPPPMTAFHGKCIGCHRAMADGPVVCRDCHAQVFSGPHGVVKWDHLSHARRIDMGMEGGIENNCIKCHHQDKEAKTEGDYRACSACHKPAETIGLAVATGIKFHEKLLHGDCKRCHTVQNPEEGRRTCKDCHTSWNVDTKKKRPASEQAVHKLCLECHNVNYKGLTEGMPTRCVDCHEPDPSVIADVEVGLIMWDHGRHAQYGEGMRCDRCHHTDKPDQPHMACNKCHGTGVYQNPSVADALRKRCLGCHKEKNNGLASWKQFDTDRKQVNLYKYEAAEGDLWWDHRGHAIGWSFSCRNCHHAVLRKDGKFVTESKAKVAWDSDAAQIQTCTGCHGPEGPVAESPAAGSKAPKIDDIYKKVCIECHVRLGGGPQTWADYFKVEPVADGSDAAQGADEASPAPETQNL